MKLIKFRSFFLLLLCFTAFLTKAQNNSELFFIAHKKSSPDFFTIFINAEKSKESIDVYNGQFPKQSLVYNEKLISVDTIIKHKKYILIGKKSAVYKKGNNFFVEFTGFEEEGYKTKLNTCSKEKAYPEISMNCNYKIKQVSLLRYRLDSILGHGNYSGDFVSFYDENIIFSMLNMPYNNFKDSLDFNITKFLKNTVLKEKTEIERLKNLKNSINKINYTTVEEFLLKTNLKSNIEKEILFSLAEKQPLMLIEILYKENNLKLNKNDINKAFKEYGEQKEKYKSLYNSLSKVDTKAETKQILLKNLKKGKRHANFVKTVAVTSGIIALISIPIAFMIIINL